MVQFRKTGDADFPRFLKIVNMASPKAGKTTFETSAPNGLILATPNAGLMSIAHLNYPYAEITHSEELRQTIMILGSESLRKNLAEQLGLPRIDTVSVDLLNEVQQFLVKERLKQERRTQMQRDDWNWLLNQMREIINSLVQLPMNVILSVHIKGQQDDEGKIITGPMLQGGIQDELAGYVDFVVSSQRNLEIDEQTGKKTVRYSLLVEGDNRNPHLGNRAAGRLPHEVEPNFQVLHDAIFKGREELPARQDITLSTGVGTVTTTTTDQEVAQPVGQADVAQPAAQPAPATPPAAPDEDNPINEAGIKHLTNFYKDAGFNAPSFDGWTLGFGRATARMFVAVKSDVAEGKGTWDDMVQYLKGMGETVPFQTWNGPDAEPVATPQEPPAETAPVAPAETPVETPTEAPAEAPAEPAPTTTTEQPAPVEAAPEAAPEPVTSEPPVAEVNGSASSDAPAEAAVAEAASADASPADGQGATEEEALATIQEKLGGRPIGVVEDKATPCSKCGNPVDDIDIARLAKARYGEWCCVKDYIQLTKGEPASV